MEFNPDDFCPKRYGPSATIYFDKLFGLDEHFGHKLKTRRFPYYKNILEFLEENPETKICFTLNAALPSFRREGNHLLINMRAYQTFCSTIGSKTGGRFKAFIGQKLSLEDIDASDEARGEFIRANATEAVLIEAIRGLGEDAQSRIIAAISSVQSDGPAAPQLNSDQFAEALSHLITDQNVQRAFYEQLPRIQIDTLKSHIRFLKENLDKTEIVVQGWLDEEGGKYRQQRCLIFGLQYVDPVREGSVGAGKRFDVLAEQDLERHVIFELKSPNAEVFQVKEREMAAGGYSTEYHLSRDLSRAIPEVLGYKEDYERAGAEMLQKLGIKVPKPVSKCVIVIGNRQDNSVWKEHFKRVGESLFGIELLTYNDLIDRLENTVRNLEQYVGGSH
jgi:hypothetical protein